jgi:type I restriction enzyme S subunit
MVGESLPQTWSWSTLGEVASPQGRAIVSGPFGSNIGTKFFVEKGVPVIRGNNLTTDFRRFIDRGFVFVTEDKADELGNCEAVHDDLVFTAAGSLGQVGLIPKNSAYGRYIISNKQLRARVDKSKVEPLFAFYWFSSKEMVAYIQQRNTGSSVPLINLSVLRSLPIPLPPLAEQSAIARVLGTLDDKIDLNHRMTETLEAIARALFHSWFVNFDPVRAKAEGRNPGLPKALADIFPDSLTESELGEIPTTWEVTTLGDLVELAYGKALKEESRQPGIVPVYGSNGQVGLHSEKLADGPGIIVGRKGNPGVVTWAPTDFFAIDTTFYVVTKSKCKSLYFLFYALKDHGLASLGADSAVPGLNRNMAYMSNQLLPSSALLDAFDLRVRVLFERIQKSNEQSVSLAGLRDALLPKLISGELRPPEAERIVEGHA